jgi:multiple sugar transport system ATP-binding protein
MNLFSGRIADAAGAHTLGVRPEHIDVSNDGGEWRGEVQFIERLGSDTFLHVQVPEIGLVIVRTDGGSTFANGREVFLTPRQGHTHRFNEKGMAI